VRDAIVWKERQKLPRILTQYNIPEWKSKTGDSIFGKQSYASAGKWWVVSYVESRQKIHESSYLSIA